jgi:hypothetical protein
MSWLFSQVLVEEYLGANSLDGKQFAPSSGSHTQQAFLSSDRMKAFSRLSQFGMMFKPLTDDLGEDLLTWFLVGFLVKTSAQPGKEQESKERDHPCGNTWQESSVKFDLNTLSWKTHQYLWEEDLQPSSLTLPKWGMMQSGALWERTTSLLPISETESGFLLPTPTCADTTMGAILNDNTKLITLKSGRMRKISNQGVSGSIGLARTVAMWPTPRVKGQECYETRAARKGHVVAMSYLESAVDYYEKTTTKIYPTPCATDYKGSGKNGELRDRLDYAVERVGTKSKIYEAPPQNGGQLNPTWVEWLMGWPLGWTDLKPLGMDKFLLWLNSHGKH